MKIFVTGCLHGNWDLLFDTVNEVISQGTKIDLIIVTGDAETLRSEEDLKSFAAPPKYQKLGTFYKLYNGEKKLPALTIVVGGNHESSDFLHVLPFGGWLAENVFYTGRANSLRLGDLTITAISGLYKPEQYFRPVDEQYPIRSVSDLHTAYHIRAFSDFQILGLSSTDIMISHEWPSTIPSKYGGEYLQRRRRDLIKCDQEGNFGLPKGIEMINKLKPSSWFAAHHHITFQANIGDTSFHAIPKPTRPDWYLIADFDGDLGPLKYRGEWLSILKATTEEMANPKVLDGIDWQQKWEQMKPELEKIEDTDVRPFELNPFMYTADFCSTFGVYCPNEEVRDFMVKNNIPFQ
ncbi:Lariat debranching enzyme [Histomonas meleagridis]|uniref:Lariat debranching enzyme n=1 Tax=Histomonas meleagridis TaxID=135588 RepID=UPI00355A2787|nr:Lariat debranching enzyme [Histomonas meleagridis]KAH0805523.1 Lariat debranching enzyme [Histomonas meleagridis]